MISPGMINLIGSIVAALLTVMVLSYLVGDNAFFRLAVHIFVGTAAGYAGALIWQAVLRPAFVDPVLLNGVGVFADFDFLLPLALVLLLLLKVSPATSRLGTFPLALLVGVVAAVVVGGAITGTLIPQTLASMTSILPVEANRLTGETGFESILNVLIVLIATVSTLFYFAFSGAGEKPGVTTRIARSLRLDTLGRYFIAITFGVMYAGTLMAAIIVLSERVQFLRDTVLDLLSG